MPVAVMRHAILHVHHAWQIIAPEHTQQNRDLKHSCRAEEAVVIVDWCLFCPANCLHPAKGSSQSLCRPYDHQSGSTSLPPCPCPCAAVVLTCSYPYLLFGLDAAVFESGNRRLPWQDTQPSAVVSEAGKQHGQGVASTSAQKGSAGSNNLPPHWFSHVQHKTTVQERDRATRAQYAALARRSQGLHGMHVTTRTALPS